MGHLEGNFTPILYMGRKDARFLKVNESVCSVSTIRHVFVKWEEQEKRTLSITADVEGCNDEEEATVQQEKEVKVMKIKTCCFVNPKWNLVGS